MALKDLYEIELGEGEAAFVFHGYSAITLRRGDKVVMFDVADLVEPEEVESLSALFVTHSHYDHFNDDVIVRIFERTDAYVVAEESAYSSLRGKVPEGRLIKAVPGAEGDAGGLIFKCVEGVHVGGIVLYQVKVDGLYIFHGGDSGYVRLEGLRADVAFLPVGDPSPTASPESALRMAEDLRPKVVVPIHGSLDQFSEFERMVGERIPQVKVVRPARGRVEKVEL